MAKITTADCKKFLAEFFKATPDLIVKLYGEPSSANTTGTEALAAALNEKNWIRVSKRKPDEETADYEAFIKGEKYPQGPMYRGLMHPLSVEDVVAERRFVLLPSEYDTAIQFLVLEDSFGHLHLGDYIGD